MRFYIILFCIIAPLVTLSVAIRGETQENRYRDIENILLGMLIRPAEEGNNSEDAVAKETRKMELPKLTKTDLIFASLEKLKASIEDADLLPSANVVTPDAWKDLELFTNASKIPEKTVIGAIKRTQTAIGELTLTRILLDPLTDIAAIKARQKFIGLLATNDELFQTLSNALARVAAEEVNLIAMLRATDLFNQEAILNWYDTFGRIPSPFVRSTILNSLHLAAICMLPFFCYAAYRAGSTALTGIQTYQEHENIGLITVFGLISLLSCYRTFEATRLIKELASTATYIQRRLSSVQVLFSQIPLLVKAGQEAHFSELSSYIDRYMNSSFPQLKPLASALSASAFIPPRDGSMPGLMQNILSNQGTVANALLEAKKVLPIMLNGLLLVGHLDAYLSLATLLRERQHSEKAPYCFVEFIEKAQTPQIYAENFYHPVLPPEKIVLNNLYFDASKHPNNIVISGVNAGGKSTIMKALTISCILGQTVGLAPAKKFLFTPFHRISTYLNITDDASKQQSLFRAELARALALLKLVDGLPKEHFSLTILDELCTGTEAREGEALAFAVAEKLASYPNSITLLSTHFAGLIELEYHASTRVKNMKVIVNRNKNGDFIYPYQIFPGATTQQIAPDLLEQIGLPLVMTEKMRDVLNNPNKYLPKRDRS